MSLKFSANLFPYFILGIGIHTTIGGDEYKRMMARWTSLNLYVTKGVHILLS